MTVSHVAECPDLGPQCFTDSAQGALEPSAGPLHHPDHSVTTPYNHHIDQLIAETSFAASLGITPYLAIDARWSLRVTDVRPSYTELDGSPKDVPDDIHHHDETLVDVTDPWLLARVGASAGKLVSMVRIGASLPLGRTEPDPYALGRQGESHEHLQAGTGTVVPILGFGLSYTIAPVTLGVGGVAFFSMYDNAYGYRAPSRLYGNQRTSLSLLDGVVVPFAEVSIAHITEEYWQGLPGLEGTAVRTEVYLGGGGTIRLAERWSLDAAVSGRVATVSAAPTFKTYGLFSLGLTAQFDVWDATADKTADGVRIEEHRQGDVIEFEKKR